MENEITQRGKKVHIKISRPTRLPPYCEAFRIHYYTLEAITMFKLAFQKESWKASRTNVCQHIIEKIRRENNSFFLNIR